MCQGTSLCANVTCSPVSQCHVAGEQCVDEMRRQVEARPHRVDEPSFPAFCLTVGTCSLGVCSTPTKPQGSICNDQNSYSKDDVCDGDGNCAGSGRLKYGERIVSGLRTGISIYQNVFLSNHRTDLQASQFRAAGLLQQLRYLRGRQLELATEHQLQPLRVCHQHGPVVV